MRARKKLSPRWPWAPSSMFCSTVSRDSALVSWKVRTTPSRATWCGDELAQRPAVEGPGAGVGLVEAGQQVEQRGLAGAVRADQAGDAAALDLQVVDRHGGETAEGAGDAVDDDRRVGLGDADLPREVAQRDLGEPLRGVAAVEAPGASGW